MRVSIVGFNLPGRTSCGPDGSPVTNVLVGIQLRRDPAQLMSADAAEVSWEVDIDVVERSWRESHCAAWAEWGTMHLRHLPAAKGHP